MSKSNHFEGATVVVTEKMDGENITIDANGCYPRSLDTGYKTSRDWVIAFAKSISPKLKKDERIVGENMYARHCIDYGSLPSYFIGFAWINGSRFANWTDTVGRFSELGIETAPVLYQGRCSQLKLRTLADRLDFGRQEGYVVRLVDSFEEEDMPLAMAKWVRYDHAADELLRKREPFAKNELASSTD